MKVIENDSLLDSLCDNTQYRTYRYRFVVLINYTLLTFLGGLMAICMSSITTNLENIYSLHIFIINLGTSLIWYVLYAPMSFVANYILDEKGLRANMLFAATLLLAGLWLRTLSEKSFYFIFAGQFLGALGLPCLLNAPQKLSAVWFPPNERPLSTAIASVADPLGAGAGLVIAHFFVSNDANGVPGLKEVNHLMFGVAIIGTIIIIPTYFLFRDKPPSPPSRGAETRKSTYKQSMRLLSKNRNYIIFIISAGFAWASVCVLSSLLQPLFAPYGFQGSQAGTLGAITLLFGLFGSILWGIYLKRTKRYKRSLIICASMSIVSVIGIILLLRTGSMAAMVAITVVYGLFTIPLLALSFEFCAEISFPVAEGAAGGFMVLMMRLFSVGGILSTDALLNDDSREHALYGFLIMIFMLSIALIGFLFTQEDLKRARLEAGSNISYVEKVLQ